MSKIIWDRSTSLNVIHLLREYEELWNPGHPDYKNQVQREEARKQILLEIQLQIPEVKISDIKIKIHSLQSQYRREIRELNKLKEQGANPLDIKPTLWCFNELKFLSYVTVKQVTTNEEEVDLKIVKPAVVAGVAWSRGTTLTLIHMLEERAELWDRAHPEFKNLPHKKVLLNEILTEIHKEMPDAEIADIRDKIHTLRCQYRKEIRILRKKNMNAVHTGEIYKSLLWCFNELKFLSHSKQTEVDEETNDEIQLIELVNQPSEMSGIVWSRSTVLTLIELLKEHEELWDSMHSAYKDNAQRNVALRKILPHIEKHMPDVNINEIRLKIHTLRSQYQRELRALEEKLKQSSVEPDKITPKLWCFYELQFLGDIRAVRKYKSNKLAEKDISKRRMKRVPTKQIQNEITNDDMEFDLWPHKEPSVNSESSGIQIERWEEPKELFSIEDINRRIKKEAPVICYTEEEIVAFKIERQPMETITPVTEEPNEQFEFVAIKVNKPSVKAPAQAKSIWNRRTILMLIQLLRQHELLWNPKHVDYKNKRLWRKALNEILNAIKIKLPNIKYCDIKNKIHSLKSQYRREVLSLLKTYGIGIDDYNMKTKSKLWCFNELEFLGCTIKERFNAFKAANIAYKRPVASGFAWNRRAILTLIHMLQERIELWDREHPSFKNLPHKKVLLNEILAEIQKEMPDAEIVDIKLKIRRLRYKYHKVIDALKKSNRSNALDVAKIHSTKLWCFDELKYLSHSKCEEGRRKEEIALIKLANQSSPIPAVVWKRSIILTLIELLKERKVLWNAKHPNFRNKAQKEKALREILLQVQKQIPNAKLVDIQKKIHTLQGRYWKEIRKLKRLNRNVDKPSEILKPKLWCFYELKFLKSSTDMDIDESELPVENNTAIEQPRKIHGDRAKIEVNAFAVNNLSAPITGVEWNRPNTLYLIELLKQHEELWNLGHPGYRDKAIKCKAINEILAEVQIIMPDAEISHIKTKIHSLRSQYRREIRGLEKTEVIERPKLWCFDQLQFLGYSAYMKSNQKQAKKMPRIQVKDEAIKYDTKKEVDFIEKAEAAADESDSNLFVLESSTINDVNAKRFAFAKQNIKIATKQLAETNLRNSILSGILTEKKRKNEHASEEVVGLMRLENVFSQILKRIRR